MMYIQGAIPRPPSALCTLVRAYSHKFEWARIWTTRVMYTDLLQLEYFVYFR